MVFDGEESGNFTFTPELLLVGFILFLFLKKTILFSCIG